MSLFNCIQHCGSFSHNTHSKLFGSWEMHLCVNYATLKTPHSSVVFYSALNVCPCFIVASRTTVSSVHVYMDIFERVIIYQNCNYFVSKSFLCTFLWKQSFSKTSFKLFLSFRDPVLKAPWRDPVCVMNAQGLRLSRMLISCVVSYFMICFWFNLSLCCF